jgi:IS30 family transposase
MRSPGRPTAGRLEHRQRFWAAIARGLSSEDAAAEAGVSAAVGVRWFREGGGMPSVTLAAPSGRYLSFAEREEIAILRAGGRGVREIARQLGAIKNGPALTGHGAEAVRDAIAGAITTLPEQLRRSLTWDQGAEMAQHAQLRIDTGLRVYFCDPQSPWQRGTNENTNGLLRQYFPKGTDLARHSTDDLAAVAAALNTRPRKTLGWRTPAEVLDDYLTTG